MKKSYRDLEIYQKAVQLSTGIHNLSLKFPKFEMYEEGSQIRRASKSIAANIVEGFGRRRYKQEFIRFLIYALASCDETRAHLEMLFKTQSLKDRNDYLFFCR
ncbi:MAG: four helix bundle protein [Candidatus Omnitrophica bacterium]|nr:four helix bundle protein [Candidatus Omnitrophota bacterium]